MTSGGIQSQQMAMTQTQLFEGNEGELTDPHFDDGGHWWDLFGEFIYAGAKSDPLPIRTLSLFSGAGGLDIGFHDAGFKIVEAVELDPKLAATLQANVGSGKYLGVETNVIVGDICEYEPDLTDIDFIIGGPPCQTFSAAGARASGVAGTNDTRGNLFKEYVRILRKLQPKAFLFENVYRVLGANSGRDWEEIRLAFAEVGYDLNYRILDTADYGVPQYRERLIIIGTRKSVSSNIEFRFPRPTHGPDSLLYRPYSSSNQALVGINDLPEKTGLSGRYGHLLSEIPPGLNYSFFTERMGHPDPIFSWRSKFSDFLYKADPEEPVRTIKAQGGQYTGPFHWDSRPFSIKEYKRLQTFPDNFEMIGSKATVVKQIGNSVPPQFARILALAIREQIFNRKSEIKLSYVGREFPFSFRTHKSKRTSKYAAIAKEAILALRRSPTTIDRSMPSDFRMDVYPNFATKIATEGEVYCSIARQDNWLKIRAGIAKASTQAFSVTIFPKRGWSLPFETVQLIGADSNPKTFVVLWKVLELHLSKNGIKADLEQLSGYYQYGSEIICRLSVESNFGINGITHSFLDAVIGGRVTQREMTIAEFAAETNVCPENVYSLLKDLKLLGYSVRSSKTNASMADGCYLIPYPFPTLNPLSVQLKKQI